MAAPPSAAAFQAKYLPRARLQGEGCALEPSQKVYVFSEATQPGGPLVLWELRGMIEMWGFPKQFEFHHWWRRQQPVRQSLLLALRLDRMDCRPSMKALDAGKTGIPQVFWPWCVTEWIVSTKLMLGLLLHYQLAFRKVAQRDGVKSCLKLILHRALADTAANLDATPPTGNEVSACRRPGPPDEACSHCEGARKRFMSFGMLRHLRLWELMCSLWAIAVETGCPFAQGWLDKLLLNVASKLDNAAMSAGWPTSPEGASLPRGQKRHRRLDPVAVEVACMAAAGPNKRFRSASRMIQSGAMDLGLGTGSAHEEVFMAAYFEKTFSVFSGVRHLSIALDGTTLGGEDTMKLVVWSPCTSTAAWLPPQALGSEAQVRRTITPNMLASLFVLSHCLL